MAAGGLGWEAGAGFDVGFGRELTWALLEAKREKTSGVFRVVLPPRTCDGAATDPPRVLGASGLDDVEELQRSEKASDMVEV